MTHYRTVEMVAEEVVLAGDLSVPEGAIGAVLFAHGSGSSRFSPRNRHVAGVLNDAGLATLLLDLLTAAEHDIDQMTAALRFDIDLLTRRLEAAARWCRDQEALHPLAVGLFGASTGAAAALRVAAAMPREIGAVVSRGGRVDLAQGALAQVQAPVLLIVGGADTVVLDLNRAAAEHLGAVHEVAVVDEATHLFEEPGALDAVAALARDWFVRHLAPAREGGRGA